MPIIWGVIFDIDKLESLICMHCICIYYMMKLCQQIDLLCNRDSNEKLSCDQSVNGVLSNLTWLNLLPINLFIYLLFSIFIYIPLNYRSFVLYILGHFIKDKSNFRYAHAHLSSDELFARYPIQYSTIQPNAIQFTWIHLQWLIISMIRFVNNNFYTSFLIEKRERLRNV